MAITATAISQINTGLKPYLGAPGFRFIKDLYPTSREGGLNYYPYSAVKNGLTPSWTLAAAAPVSTPANITVAVAAGQALLDSQVANLTTGVNVVITPQGINNGDNYFRIFLNPTRIVQPVVASGGTFTPPTTRLNGNAVQNGDIYAQAVDYPDHLEAFAFYQLSAGTWSVVDPAFIPPTVPAQRGRNRVFGNNTDPVVNVNNFTVNQIEVPIYIATQFPVYGYKPAPANLRNPASLEIATLDAYYYVLPLNISGTFTNGSTSVTLDLASQATFADIVNSIPATTALALDGAALAASGYNATTGVVTLAANYSGTSGDKQVLLTPVTSGNDYIMSVGLSQLYPTENLTNP